MTNYSESSQNILLRCGFKMGLHPRQSKNLQACVVQYCATPANLQILGFRISISTVSLSGMHAAGIASLQASLEQVDL